MFKILLALIAVLGIAYGALVFNGYQLNPHHLPHYLPQKLSISQEVELKNGMVLTGEVIEETDTSIRLNMDGAITDFAKSQIQEIRLLNKNFFTQYQETLVHQSRVHPLMSRKKGMSAAASMDKSSTGFLKTITQVDKLEQMEKLKKDIGKIASLQEERSKQVDEIIAAN